MAQILGVYKEAEILNAAAASAKEASGAVAIVSYDDPSAKAQEPGATAPDLPPKPGIHATFSRDHEPRRHGALSLLAGIDLLTGKVHALVEERHRSREFIEFLKLLNRPIRLRPRSKLSSTIIPRPLRGLLFPSAQSACRGGSPPTSPRTPKPGSRHSRRAASNLPSLRSMARG